MRQLAILCCGLVAMLIATTTANADCLYGWSNRFGFPGVYGNVYSSAVFDDGNGPALFVCGSFSYAGRVPAGGVAKWDGTNWYAAGDALFYQFVGSVNPGAELNASVVFDDGTGPALYVAGRFQKFTTAGGTVFTQNVAKWDGTSWSAVGPGLGVVDVQATEYVKTLFVFDDGAGPALYAGGTFTKAGPTTTLHIAKWNGTAWSAVGTGFDGSVNALASFNDGSGIHLYAGGEFTDKLAKWTGTNWSTVGSGIACCTNCGVCAVNSLYDDPTATSMYVGGRFATAGGLTANNIAKWDGTNWSVLGSGVVTQSLGPQAFATYDDGHGSQLYVVGQFNFAGGIAVPSLARWDGTAWSKVPFYNLALGGNRHIRVYDDGAGPSLFIAGAPPGAGISRWDGSRAYPLASPALPSPSYVVYTATMLNDSNGPALYAGGAFLTVGSMYANGIARWDGNAWSALGDGIRSLILDGQGNIQSEGSGQVHAITEFDDGFGPKIVAGGSFTSAGGIPAKNIAQWDGTTWSTLGSGIVYDDGTGFGGGGFVYALAVFEDGSGSELYAGGQFTSAGGVNATNVARWNGSSWSPVGGGVGSGGGESINAFAVFQGKLYAAGNFSTAGGNPAYGVAQWDGVSWSGTGLQQTGADSPSALAVLDDGAGPALYAGGYFLFPGFVESSVAKWDGSHWTRIRPFRDVDYPVLGFAVFDDGHGPALYTSNVSVEKWDGSTWSVVGTGGAVGHGLAAFYWPSGRGLYAFGGPDGGGGGDFIDGQPSYNLAEYICYVPDCNDNGVPDAQDIASGTSHDCDQNGMPDDCEEDCNHDGFADVCTLGSHDCNQNGHLDECDLANQISQDCNEDYIPDECEHGCTSGEANGINNGQSVSFSTGQNDPTQSTQVTFTNNSGAGGATITVNETTDPLFADTGQYGVLGHSVIVHTNLANGQFRLQLTIPFAASDLNGHDPLTAQLVWHNPSTGDWELAVQANTQNSPGYSTPVGDSFIQSGPTTPSTSSLSADLGDYGAFWNTTTNEGFVWANLDHASTFAVAALLIQNPSAPVAEVGGIDKVRYLSFAIPMPATAAGQTAIQVKLVSLMRPNPPNLLQFPAPDFTAQEGTARYVGAPGDCQESETPPTTFKCAPLQCAPVYMDWEAALGSQTLHITGQAVVPSSTYEVRQLAASCQGNEMTCTAVSAPMTVATARWGDVAAAFQAPSPAPLTQPNISDVAACVDKFKSVPTAIIVARADVNPAVPNERVDIADVANIVDAFKNLAYPFPGPAACP